MADEDSDGVSDVRASTMRGNLLLIEHTNTNVASWPETQAFYEALGCQKAPKKAIHMNCGGHTQFHLPLDQPVQLWRGEVTIAYRLEGLAAACDRLQVFRTTPAGSAIDIDIDAADGTARVVGPWGSFALRTASPAEAAFGKVPTLREGTSTSVGLGVVGIVELSLALPLGSAAPLARFYSEALGFEVECGAGEAVVHGGPVPRSQRLRFFEQAGAPPYAGEHFCFYMRGFEDAFERCLERGLLYVNPRFTHLDDSLTLEQARHFQAFRIMRIPAAASSERGSTGEGSADALVEEHEIRSERHPFIPLPAEWRL